LHLLKRRQAELGLDTLAERAAPPTASRLDGVELRDVIDRLSLEQREVVLLYYLEGYSSTEIARIVEVPVGTVCSRLARAREHLRRELGEDDEGRPHLRYLAQLLPAQREQAMSAAGLPFSQLSLAQQQGLIAHMGSRLHSLQQLAGETLRVEYTQPGGFRWAIPGPEDAGSPANAISLPEGRWSREFGLSPVYEPTREAALSAARRLDARVPEAQIVPTSLSLAVVYLLIDPQTGKLQEMGVRAREDGARISW
jgi:hypothetical protein